ncbi:MAG: 4Fe-4S ferredoxin, iron-sulfur binding [Herbinix sp.]|nr:4Fe-4S ferredoxin, iron-sulfur binding [Herbinix sp.]
MRKILSWWKKYAYIVMLIIMLIGIFYPKVMLVFIICMLGPSLTGLFTGRFWCGNICPIGNFFDHLTIKISNDKKAPSLFKSKYIRIIFTILMMSMFSFEMIFAFRKPVMMGMVFYEMILEAIIIGTFLSVIYHYRVWCHLCPMGSTGALVTHLSNRKKVLNVSLHCSACKKCEEKCPMGLAPYEYRGKKLSSYNCIQCGICKTDCTSNAIR